MSVQVLRFALKPNSGQREVLDLGGRVLHQFSPTVFVAELPAAVTPDALEHSQGHPIEPLDAGLQLAVDAWQSLNASVDAAPTATEGLSWDTDGFQSPSKVETAPSIAASPVLLSTGTPTSLYMVGSVAVGIVLVSRDQGSEVLSSAEQTTIIQQVQRGLHWLATAEPRARLTFSYDIRPVTVTTNPGPDNTEPDDFEKFEKGWRDAALASLGYGAGAVGYRAYAQDIQRRFGTRWAYVAFFTKYQLKHFAYAIDEKVVMDYANDGWGPANIHRVFAHESCHIFGAADEYGSCVCGGSHGQLGVPNNNCVNCFPPGNQVACLMNANTLAMCEWSRRQIGWDDPLLSPPRPLLGVRLTTGAPEMEVHVLSGVNDYQQWLLQKKIPIDTADAAPGRWQFTVGNYEGTDKHDLIGVRLTTGAPEMEIHILSGQSDYQQWLLQKKIPIDTADAAPGRWQFMVGNYEGTNKPDLIGVRLTTGAPEMEIHILSGQSDYQQWLLQKKIPIDTADAAPGRWQFGVGDYDKGGGASDLMGVRLTTGAPEMEVHILSGSSDYQRWLLQKKIPIDTADAAPERWQFSTE